MLVCVMIGRASVVVSLISSRLVVWLCTRRWCLVIVVAAHACPRCLCVVVTHIVRVLVGSRFVVSRDIVGNAL